MLRYNILNSKETKNILEKLESQFGWDVIKSELDFAFLTNNDNRIYVVTKDLGKIPFDDMKIDSAGIYFGEIYKDQIRLSIEGAQIVGAKASKNVFELTKEQMNDWIMGKDIDFEDTGSGFIIVEYLNPKTAKKDILGCGKYNKQTGKLVNYVSKSRRLVVIND